MKTHLMLWLFDFFKLCDLTDYVFADCKKLSDAVKGGARKKEGDAWAPLPSGNGCLPSSDLSIFVGDRIEKNSYVSVFQCTKPR